MPHAMLSKQFRSLLRLSPRNRLNAIRCRLIPHLLYSRMLRAVLDFPLPAPCRQHKNCMKVLISAGKPLALLPICVRTVSLWSARLSQKPARPSPINLVINMYRKKFVFINPKPRTLKKPMKPSAQPASPAPLLICTSQAIKPSSMSLSGTGLWRARWPPHNWNAPP